MSTTTPPVMSDEQLDRLTQELWAEHSYNDRMSDIAFSRCMELCYRRALGLDRNTTAGGIR